MEEALIGGRRQSVISIAASQLQSIMTSMRQISKEKDNPKTKKRTTVSIAKWKVSGKGKSSGRLSQNKLRIAPEKGNGHERIGESSEQICRGELMSAKRRKAMMENEHAICLGEQ